MLAMPDSIRVADLPPGYPAYLGYEDGRWATVGQLIQRFPSAHIVGLTVTGLSSLADGADIEPANLTVADGAAWARQRINRQPGFRPVLYAGVLAMEDVITQLSAVKIDRAEVRLLTAHWGAGEHICGPRTCGLLSTDADGTQWTNAYHGVNGHHIDMSLLRDDFFGDQTEVWVRELGIARQGDTGDKVRTVQGLCAARNAGPDGLAIDGIFGPQTKEAVVTAQQRAHITADGIVGPQTWPVLLGIA